MMTIPMLIVFLTVVSVVGGAMYCIGREVSMRQTDQEIEELIESYQQELSAAKAAHSEQALAIFKSVMIVPPAQEELIKEKLKRIN